jgi:hypothetical protein
MRDDAFDRFVENLARWDTRRQVTEGLAELRKKDRTGRRLGLKRERKKGGAGSSGAPAALYRTKH